MVESLPTDLVLWQYFTDTDNEGHQHGWYAAVPVDEEKVNVPTLLVDGDGWENPCVHVKPVLESFRVQIGGRTLAEIPHINDYHGVYYYTRNSTSETCRGMHVTDHIFIRWSCQHMLSNGYESVDCSYTKGWELQKLTHGGGSTWARARTLTRRNKYIYRVKVPKGHKFYHFGPELLGSYFRPADSVGNWGNNNTYGHLKFKYLIPSRPASALLFNELDTIFGGGQFYPLVRRFQASAFYNAYQQFPKYSDNNIGNLMEMASLLIDMFRGKFPDISNILDGFRKGTNPKKLKKSLGDAWLTYRYVYGTTKADVLQALDACSRRQITYLKTQHYNGIYHAAVPASNGENLTCRVGFDVRQQTSDMLRALHHYAYLHGLDLSLYALWDLVPFSFMVDWVWDVGGALQVKKDTQHYSDYVVTDVVWSLKYYSYLDNFKYRCYARWYDNNIPDEGIDPSSGDPQFRTFLKRGLDVASIIPF